MEDAHSASPRQKTSSGQDSALAFARFKEAVRFEGRSLPWDSGFESQFCFPQWAVFLSSVPGDLES